jgi:hypothetical protein
MSVNADLENHTPFSAATLIVPDQDGQEVLILVFAATFAAKAGTLVVADDQSPIRPADEYRGDPATSSLRYESDCVIEKPRVDILVNGSAYAPKGRPAREISIELRVGDIRKELVVSGDRSWRRTPVGEVPSTPEPFSTMPIVFERAFGGTDKRNPDPANQSYDMRNPVGVGYRGARSSDPSVETEVPNLEYPSERVRLPSDNWKPASLGVVGRSWEPRIRYAGTYDARWLERQWPLLPLDFDARFCQCAPDDQQSSTVMGGDIVMVRNMTPEGIWTFALPSLTAPVRFYFDDRKTTHDLRVDTVFIEPDLKRVTLTARISIRTARSRGALRQIVIGHMTRAWLRAHDLRKVYFDYHGTGGVETDVPPFSL